MAKKKHSIDFRLKVIEDYLFNEIGGYRIVAKKYGICPATVKFWVGLYDSGGKKYLAENSNSPYSGDFRVHVVEYMYENTLSAVETAIHFGIRGTATILKWIKLYKEYGKEGLLSTNTGRRRYVKKQNEPSGRSNPDQESPRGESGAESGAQGSQDGECLPKKIARLSSRAGEQDNAEKAKIISELRAEGYSLDDLLKTANMPRSTYYEVLKRLERPDKYKAVKEEILKIEEENMGTYGYRRVTDELINRGFFVNHKVVSKLMSVLGVKCMLRIKRYHYFKGKEWKAVPNFLDRDFSADKPMQKWVTDITEFAIDGRKLYLSVVVDLFNGEVVSYQMTNQPVLNLVMTTMSKVLDNIKIPEGQHLIIHSDQGWHYRHPRYKKLLKDKGIIQSMSRKGNCLDNAVAENFFSILKAELPCFGTFKTRDELKKGIEDYIDYYNNRRIKSKLRRMSPVEYRLQYAQVA